VGVKRGIPVATVAVNNSTNAGLLAIRILSAGMPRLIIAMEKYMTGLETEVLAKVDRLADVGWERYNQGST
jgi:phosphoribosylaminoimidazole carboxylase